LSEERILRQRLADLEIYDDRTSVSPNDCDVSVLGTTAVKVTYPTTANCVYFLTTGQIDAQDTEGATATIAPDSGSLFALNLGTGIPPVGTPVVVTTVGGRNVFRFDGGTTTSS
jgi:hypothetical protein